MHRRTLPLSGSRSACVLVVGILLFAMTGGATADAREDEGESRLGVAFLKQFGRDIGQVITAPARWDGIDLLTLAAVSGSGLLLMSFDQDIQDWAQDRRTESSDRASAVFTVFGDGAALLGLSAAIYAAGEIGHDAGLRRTALLSVESLAAASLLVWTAKVVFGRARPYSGESSHSFQPFALKSSYWSLPSGHAAASFAVATTIALRSSCVFVDVTAYTMACLAGMARVHDNKHWASDFVLGSALGYFVGRKIVDLNRPGEKKTLSLGFQCSGGGQAVSLSISF